MNEIWVEMATSGHAPTTPGYQKKGEGAKAGRFGRNEKGPLMSLMPITSSPRLHETATLVNDPILPLLREEVTMVVGEADRLQPVGLG
jgi:hypothetical protein